jgi:hypothetical protein
MRPFLTAALGIAAWLPLSAQEADPAAVAAAIGQSSHAECSFFGPQHDRFLNLKPGKSNLGALTTQVSALLSAPRAAASTGLPSLPGGGRTFGKGPLAHSDTLIDNFIYAKFQANNVTPADKTNDYEFIRRVTLDLTGRIPTADRVLSFVADTTPTKRANLVDELLASPAWLDKWTMFFGDMYKSAAAEPSAGLNRFVQGRDGFNTWIRNSLTSGKPYDQMARELIASKVNSGNTTYNFTQGELNWIYNGKVTNVTLRQDDFDQMAANVAETFLGIAHMNCLLCHNGRGHLDTLSLWGGSFTRAQAWGFSGFMAHTSIATGDASATNGARYTYPNDAGFPTDYQLNTATGNRPPRTPLPSGSTVKPLYPFSGNGAKAGETYRESMAREVTSDFQFARAAVNYLWAAFFGRGIVDPPNQFDPARLDPANPPPDPWTLQPSHPELLNALAKDFIDSGYNVQHVMRLIANSDTYQLSSYYDPAKWNPDWEPLFARKLVRRLWGEEVADSLAISSNIANSFRNNDLAGTQVSFAMQLAETALEANNAFLAAFLPGNRDDTPRSDAGNIQQALAMMNDSIVMSKLTTGDAKSTNLLARAMNSSNGDSGLIDMLYLNILSRHATAAEKQSGLAFLSTGIHANKAQELMWTLYNKVDFIFNY